MPMRPQNGPQTGSQNGPMQPDPRQQNAALATWLDDVIAAGGVTADATDVTRLQGASEHLTDIIAAGGTELAPEQERLIGSLARDLRQVSLRGDRTVATGDTAYPTLLGQAEYRLEEFLDGQGELLSDAAKTLLTGALDTLETIYADGVVSADEQASVGTAADAVCSVLKDDFVKLSDAGLEALQGQSDDITTLMTDGFLALDDTQWAAVNAADTALAALLAGGGSAERTAVHAALEGLHEVLPGAILGLASPIEGLGARNQYGGGAGAGLFAI